jgi:hypothetical protein
MKSESIYTSSLKRGLLLGLGWINSTLQEFAIDTTQKTFSSKDDVAQIKPISELALTIWILRRCGIKIPILESIKKWIWRECNKGKYLTYLLLARNDFLPACSFYTALYQLGYYSKTLHSVVKMLSESDMAMVLPLQPWSRLALDYNLWKLRLLRQSKVRKSGLYIMARPEPWAVSGEIAYSITHEVFYLSDFGFRQISNSNIVTYLKTWIPYWIKIFKRDQNNDLVGEFAMAWSCIGGNTDALRKHPIYYLLADQMNDGSILGPTNASSFLYKKDDLPTRRYFLARYHTTLVFLMAIALTLRIYILLTDKNENNV